MPNAAGWTADEDVYLCQAYTNTSEDGAIATDQSADTYWTRVHATYELLAGSGSTPRKATALQSRWADSIRPDVALFASALASAEAERRSGWTDGDYVAEAESRFTAKREQLNANALKKFAEGKSKSKNKPRVLREAFCFMHCYEVLKKSPRFMRDIPQSKNRQRSDLDDREDASSDAEHTETLTSATNEDEVFETADLLFSPPPSAFIQRPSSAGKKKSKQLQFEEQVDKSMMLSQRELAKATSAQVEIMQQQLEVAKQKVSIMEAQHQASKEQAEMAVMCISTEGLSDVGKEYLLIKQRQLLEKLRNESEHS